MKRFLIVLALISLVPAVVVAADWEERPAACPESYNGQGNKGEELCGLQGDTPFFYPWDGADVIGSDISVGPSTPNVGSKYASGLDGGFVVNCEANRDASEPYCDNGGGFWCNPDSACINDNEKTKCSDWTSEGSDAYSCSQQCLNSYRDCDLGDASSTDDAIGASSGGQDVDSLDSSTDQCEVEYNKDAYPTITITGDGTYNSGASGGDQFITNGSCKPTCQNNHYNSDGVVENGCEIDTTETVTVDGIQGSYTCNYVGDAPAADNCTFVPGRSNFTTGKESKYRLNDDAGDEALLDGKLVGDGLLAQLSSGEDEGFEVLNDGTVVIGDLSNESSGNDTTVICPNGGCNNTLVQNETNVSTSNLSNVFSTGEKTVASTEDPLLYGQQNGTGPIANLSNDDGREVVVDENGNLGVGIDDPDFDTELHVVGPASSNADFLLEADNRSSRGWGFIATQGEDLQIASANGTSFDKYFTIKERGDIGVGTTTPGEFGDRASPIPGKTVHIKNASGQAAQVIDGATSRLDFVDANGADTELVSSLVYDDGVLKAGPSRDTGGFNGAGLAVDSSGSVGVGTTDPARALDVSGQAEINNPNMAPSSLTVQANGTWGGDLPVLQVIREDPSQSARTQYIESNDDEWVTGIRSGDDAYQIRATNPSIDGEMAFYAERNGDIGLGTTSPSEPLEVNTSGTGEHIAIRNNESGQYTGLKVDEPGNEWTLQTNPTGFQVKDETNSVNAIQVESSTGNVGLGTGSPSDDLVVESAESGQTSIEVANTDSGDATLCLDYDSQCTGTDYFILRQQNNGNAVVGNWETGGDVLFRTENTERMRIDSNGNIGIGTSSPSEFVDIQGNVDASEFEVTGGSDDWTMRVGGSGDDLIFDRLGGEKLRVRQDGRLIANEGASLSGSLILPSGTSVNEVSTDTALADSSDDAVPTEDAVKTYVDNQDSDSQTLSTTADAGTGTNDEISITNGNTIEVDDDYEANTDNQNISLFEAGGKSITLNLEDGGTEIASFDGANLSTDSSISGGETGVLLGANNVDLSVNWGDAGDLNASGELNFGSPYTGPNGDDFSVLKGSSYDDQWTSADIRDLLTQAMDCPPTALPANQIDTENFDGLLYYQPRSECNRGWSDSKNSFYVTIRDPRLEKFDNTEFRISENSADKLCETLGYFGSWNVTDSSYSLNPLVCTLQNHKGEYDSCSNGNSIDVVRCYTDSSVSW